MSTTVRFADKARKTSPLATDFIIGTDILTGNDVQFQFADIATSMRVLLADVLLSVDDRTTIDTPTPAVTLRSMYHRGPTAPAVDVNNANPGAGWATDPGIGTDAVWQIQATFNNGAFIPPWGVAIKITGEQGISGLPGGDGVNVITPANEYFFQDTFPTTGLHVNDIVWRPSENYKIYRWDGSVWQPAFQPFLNTDTAGRVSGLVRAGDTSDKAFVLIADRFQIWNGVSADAPFEIIDNVTYIKEVVVRQLAAAKIIGGSIVGQEIILSGTGSRIRSSDFVTGVSGWQIDAITGAEFPSLIVRSGNLEVNAATRRYGANFSGILPYTAGTWQEIAAIDVVMDSGNSAIINIAFQHIQNGTAPFATDMTIKLLRDDGSVVTQIGQSLRAGASTLITYCFFDETPTPHYSLQLLSGGGPGGAAFPSISAIIFRK